MCDICKCILCETKYLNFATTKRRLLFQHFDVKTINGFPFVHITHYWAPVFFNAKTIDIITQAARQNLLVSAFYNVKPI